MRFLIILLSCLAIQASAQSIILEPGLGDSADSFDPIGPLLTAPAASYIHTDFANPDTDGVHSGQENAAVIHQWASEGGLPPPYILVGHSLGSMNMLAFAKAYPDEVAAIVLIDGRLPTFEANCIAANASPCRMPELMTSLLPAEGKADLAGFDVTDWPTPNDLGGIPVVLLVSEKRPLGTSPNFVQVWQQTATDYAANLQNGRVVMFPTGHYIHHEDPEGVAAIINAFIQ